MRSTDFQLLVDELNRIKGMGWIKNRRPENVGGVGNTLEDLLELAENNLQLPDFGDWEIKTQRRKTSSLLTLFHCEPEPRPARIVPQVLLPLYGWAHKEAGVKHGAGERSFRQTINATSCSDRGFKVNVDRYEQIIYISFDYNAIDDRHDEWRQFILEGVGTGDVEPSPYWTFATIEQLLNTKLNNLMYIKADSKYIDGEEHFKYTEIEAHINPTLDKFLALVEDGSIYIDFDARTGHNHGTKYRIKPDMRSDLYEAQIFV
ncbi:MAG: MvaI/BcnI restriction endonuclease family protein [Christensenellaceae bacterium]|nr:MvaI/BcnI restriction endonuclease family protein [Christensenellaceae bacterium]